MIRYPFASRKRRPPGLPVASLVLLRDLIEQAKYRSGQLSRARDGHSPARSLWAKIIHVVHVDFLFLHRSAAEELVVVASKDI